jgi:hypothetical protein
MVSRDEVIERNGSFPDMEIASLSVETSDPFMKVVVANVEPGVMAVPFTTHAVCGNGDRLWSLPGVDIIVPASDSPMRIRIMLTQDGLVTMVTKKNAD